MRTVATVSLVSLLAIALVLSLAAAQARANPHVWAEPRITFELERHRVEGLTFAWRFDEYYSSHTIRTYDLDGDGGLGPADVQALRTDSFDPLARFDYYVHVWVGEARREGHRVARFSARIEDRRLVYEFSIPVAPPADPGEAPVIVSVFDRRNEVDFRFAETDFLRVDGDLRAGCRFRVARGSGEQSGHPQTVTLECGG